MSNFQCPMTAGLGHWSLVIGHWSLPNLPPFAVLFFNQPVGFSGVLGLEIGAVPLNFFAAAQGDVSQQDDLRQPRAIFKIAAGRFATFARFQPIPMMTFGAGN